MMTPNFIPTAEGLVEYAKEKLTAPNFYLWDGVGEYITDDVIDRLAAADPVWYTPERIAARRALVGKMSAGGTVSASSSATNGATTIRASPSSL